MKDRQLKQHQSCETNHYRDRQSSPGKLECGLNESQPLNTLVSNQVKYDRREGAFDVCQEISDDKSPKMGDVEISITQNE